ncbi:MAG: response regulator [Planctomycetales bacterium]|nr:response regulator [Planctomycetales bacterium]
MTDIQYQIMLVTPQIEIAQIISHRLELFGWDTQIVVSEAEMRLSLKKSLPHLFIVDLDWQDLNAITLIEFLTSDQLTSQLPVMAMSAHGDLTLAEQAFHAGAKQFLVIPFDPMSLKERVSELLYTIDLDLLGGNIGPAVNVADATTLA